MRCDKHTGLCCWKSIFHVAFFKAFTGYLNTACRATEPMCGKCHRLACRITPSPPVSCFASSTCRNETPNTTMLLSPQLQNSQRICHDCHKKIKFRISMFNLWQSRERWIHCPTAACSHSRFDKRFINQCKQNDYKEVLQQTKSCSVASW